MLAPEETKIEIILVGRQQWNESGTQASLHDKDACGDGLERLRIGMTAKIRGFAGDSYAVILKIQKPAGYS